MAETHATQIESLVSELGKHGKVIIDPISEVTGLEDTDRPGIKRIVTRDGYFVAVRMKGSTVSTRAYGDDALYRALTSLKRHVP